METTMVFVKDKKSVEDELLRLFHGFSRQSVGVLDKMVSLWHPPTDVFQSDDKLVITCEIAGLSEDVIQITTKGRLLKICGSRKEPRCIRGMIFHNMEINYGSFERNIRLPEIFVNSKIKAKYSNGFLRIELSARNTDKIEIEVE